MICLLVCQGVRPEATLRGVVHLVSWAHGVWEAFVQKSLLPIFFRCLTCAYRWDAFATKQSRPLGEPRPRDRGVPGGPDCCFLSPYDVLAGWGDREGARGGGAAPGADRRRPPLRAPLRRVPGAGGRWNAGISGGMGR